MRKISLWIDAALLALLISLTIAAQNNDVPLRVPKAE